MIPAAHHAAFNYDAAAVWKAVLQQQQPAPQQQQLSAASSSFYGARVPPSGRPCLMKPEAEASAAAVMTSAAAVMTSEAVRRALYAAALRDLMTSSAVGGVGVGRLPVQNLPHQRLRHHHLHHHQQQQLLQQPQHAQQQPRDNRRYLLHHSVTSLIAPHHAPLAELHDGIYVFVYIERLANDDNRPIGLHHSIMVHL